MQFLSSLFVGAAAFASFVAAQSTSLVITTDVTSVNVGQPITINYLAPDLDAPVTITLRKGQSSDLDTIATLTSSATGGEYTWTPEDDLVNGADYALQITQGDQINFTGQFTLLGGENAPVSSSAASSTPASTTPAITASTPLSTGISTTLILTTIPSNSSASATTPSSSRAPTSTSAGAPEETTESAPGTGAASGLNSPVALVLGAFAVLAYLQ